MAMTTVDEFVELKELPEFRGIVEMLRELMREGAPNAKSQISPAYQSGRRSGFSQSSVQPGKILLLLFRVQQNLKTSTVCCRVSVKSPNT